MIRRGAGLFLLPALVLAEVSFPSIRTTVELSSDGSAHMVQELTCRFEGRCSQLRLTYPAQFPPSRVTFNRMSERSARSYGAATAVDSRFENGTLSLKWHPRARDETRHYVIDLTVETAVRRYDDAAHVQTPVIGRAPGPVGQATIELRLPRASTGQFRVSDRAGAHGTISPDYTTGLLTRSDLEEGGRLVIDAVTDPEVFKDVAPQHGLMKEAENQMGFKGRLPEPRATGPVLPWYVVLIPLLLPLGLLLILYLMYGREPRVGYEVRYEHEPPDRIPPLAVPPIVRQQADLTELPVQTLDATLATLVDAARRGVLDIMPGDPQTGEGRGFVLAHPDKLGDLDELSRKVVDYYFSNVSQGRELITAGDIQRHAGEQPQAFRFWLKLMSQEGRDWWWKKLGVEFLEPASSMAYRVLCFIAPPVTAASWFFVPLVLPFFTWDVDPKVLAVPVFLTFLFSGAMYACLGRVILRWSPPAYYEHLRWQSFRRFLVEFSAIEQAPIELSAIWQEYYVYAVALGIGEKFMHGLSSPTAGTDLAVDLVPFLTGMPEGQGLGRAGPRPHPDTGAALGTDTNQILAAFRSGSGLQGERAGRLRPLLFWQVGKR